MKQAVNREICDNNFGMLDSNMFLFTFLNKLI